MRFYSVKLDGYVCDSNDIHDFAGTLVVTEAGFTAVGAGKGNASFNDDNGLYRRLKSSTAEGLALDVGVDDIDIHLRLPGAADS